MVDVALRWILDQPQVSSIIAGVTRREQIERNARASELAPLDAQTHARLAQFYLDQVREHIRGGI